MGIATQHVFSAVAIGIGATLLMDLWNLFLKGAFGIPSLNYCFLGRWLLHMPGGIFRHSRIAAASPRPRECAVGRIAHYSIGVVLAIGFVVLAAGWLARPSVLPALVFGVATVVFPLFVMQPALGFGIASSRTPNPTQARIKSLASHTMFGVGLYLGALLLPLLSARTR